MRIVNFGSMNLDHVYAVDHFVRGGETILSGDLTDCAGGKGLNQSVAVARSGAAICHAGMLGVGGEPLRALLDEAGVDTSLLQPCAAPQGHTVIQVTPDGQNSIIVFGGSNREVTPAYMDETLARFRAGDYLMLQNEVSNLPYALKAAKKWGLRIVLNASPINDELLGLDLHGLEWLVVNELECMALAGVQEVFEAYEALKVRYPEVGILLTLGGDGSISWKDGEEVRQQVYPAQAVDTTGAGDTFVGYFVGSLAQGLSRKEAMDLASMAASIAVSRPGAAPSIPAVSEVRARLGK
ncbi:MAG: ribokinase [Oscillospiraceae bacterium]|nr:ribokinase [Oscillospiraceae bacterium]